MVLLRKASASAEKQSGARLMAPAIAVGTLIVLLVFGAFAAYTQASESRLRRQEVSQYLHSVGQATAWGVENWLTQRVKMAEDVGHAIAMTPDMSSAVDLLRSPVFEDTFLWTYFGEADGAYHIWPLDDELPADYDPRTRPWYEAAVEAGRTTLTEPYFDIATGVDTITVATPVYRDGALLGVVGADFSTETLSNVLKRTDLGGLGHAFLVTSKGKILAHPDREVISQGLNEHYAVDAPQLDAGVQYLDGLADPEIVSFVKIPAVAAIDWRLGLSASQEKAFAGLNEFRRSAAIATLAAAFFMIVILGYVIHRLLVRPLNKARMQADAASIAKSEFLASMSHEIRTPMNGVLGMAEVLSHGDLDSRQKELVSIITSSGNALMTVINDILDFSKLEAGKLRLSKNSFNLRQTVFEMATMMQARALEKDLELIVRYAPHMPEGVIGDDARLRQVLGNLIGNAVKFTQQGYVLVEVDGERKGDDVELMISVQDTGIGIAQEQVPRMFEKFEQADASHTRKFGGTGLGLAISKNIIELMGGEINAESQIGKGSRFRCSLTLPVDESVADMQAHNTEVFGGVRVLAVDDNEVNRRVFKELLDGWDLRSTIVDSPLNAFAALEKSIAESDQYHIALLDHQMPDEDGVSLAKRMKADDRFASIPIIMLSSIGGMDAQTQEDNASIAVSLSKPVRPSQLMDAMTRMLADNAAAALRNTANKLKQADPSAVQAASDRKKILIAEDNTVNQMVLKTFISPDEYDIVIAENGQIAVDLYELHRPALVLMDLSMPVMDGLEATVQIRALEAAANMSATPIIATTAHVLQEARDRCCEAGMNDFLPKPLKKDAVNDVIERWLGRNVQNNAIAV